MGNWGIKATQSGKDINLPITKENLQYYNFITGDPTLMIVQTALVSAGSYTHNLGYKPFFLVFAVDSVANPTTYTVDSTSNCTATTTQLTGLPDSYVILFAKNY